jgi:hypothetical protein
MIKGSSIVIPTQEESRLGYRRQKGIPPRKPWATPHYVIGMTMLPIFITAHTKVAT